MPAYGEAEYWDKRYQSEPVFFDWYLSYDGLEPVLQQHIPKDASILQLGVGTSLLQAQMCQQGGYKKILSLDISSVAIKHMQEAHSDIPQLQYRVGDARSLPQYKDASFDAILDKGTLDSLMCGDHAGDNTLQMVEECHRLLKPGGVLVYITYGEPAVRVPLLQRLGLDVCFYILTKSQEVAAGAAISGTPVAGKAGIHSQGPLNAHLQPTLDIFVHSPTTYYVYIGTKPQRRPAARAAAPTGEGCSAGTSTVASSAASSTSAAS